MSSDHRELPLFPLEQVVLFPGMPLPLRIFEERYKVMIGSCQVTDQLFGVLLIRSGREVGVLPAETERVGCTARMLRVDRMPDGQMSVLTVGEQRFRLLGPPRVMPEGYLVGEVSISPEPPPALVEADLVARVKHEFQKYLSAAMGHVEAAPDLPHDPTSLSYRVGAGLYIRPRERQQLLESDDVVHRLQQELDLLRRENRQTPNTIGPFSMN